MNTHLKRLTLAMAGAAIITLVGCGGSPGGGTAAVTPEVTTADVATRVIDGAISNALVCMDKNRNGECDASEPQGRTDASGNLTLKVDKADVGKFPLLTLVGTDAVDADHGPVTEPFAMTTPPGKSSVISPLTTMVAQAMESGATEAEAEATVKGQTGITVSLFEDFVKVGKPATGQNPGDVARMIIVTTQEQNKRLQTSVGTQALDDSTISKQDLQKAVFKKVLQILPEVVIQMNNASGAGDQKAKEAAVRAGIVASLMDANALKTEVALDKQLAKEVVAGAQPYVPAAGFNIDTLGYTDTSNWSMRAIGTSLAGATPDANKLIRVFDRRVRANSGQIAKWNFGSNPGDQSILHWTGSEWANCALNFEFTATLRDAQGNNSSNYCNNYSLTSSNRVSLNVSGKSMLTVYNDAVAAGYTNYAITNAGSALGVVTFPADSFLHYQINTRTASAFAYNPTSGARVFNYSAAVAVGGDGRLQASGTGCNLPEYQVGPAIPTTTLEGMVAAFGGQPCVYGQSSFVSGATTFYEGGTQNSSFTSKTYGNSTLGIGTIGSVSIGSTPASFYTGNKLIRLGFSGTGVNPVTYYSCDQRFINGSTRNCVAIGNGNYSITTLPDGVSRVMTFSNPPATSLGNDRIFVERNGLVYFGFKDKLTVSKLVRLNSPASVALLAQLGMPAINPEAAQPLTAASYQGTWDVRPASLGFAFNVGTRIVVNANNAVQCFDNTNGSAFACSLIVTNPATGAFTYTNTGNGNTAAGTLDFMQGTGTGTLTPADLSTPYAIAVQRR